MLSNTKLEEEIARTLDADNVLCNAQRSGNTHRFNGLQPDGQCIRDESSSTLLNIDESSTSNDRSLAIVSRSYVWTALLQLLDR